jgi:hypothetical protein
VERYVEKDLECGVEERGRCALLELFIQRNEKELANLQLELQQREIAPAAMSHILGLPEELLPKSKGQEGGQDDQ